MKSRLRRPFRAPRAAILRSNKKKVTGKLDEAEVQLDPDHRESDSEEATELGLVGWIVKESEPPEVMAPEREAVYVGLDSITETGDEYEARMDREQLEDPHNGCKLTMKTVEALGAEGAQFVRGAPQSMTSDKGKGEASVESSPNLSEFEKYLDGIAKGTRRTITRRKPTVTTANKNLESDDEDDLVTVDNVEVRARAKRQCVAVAMSPTRQIALHIPSDEPNSRVISIEDILPEVMEDDDDVPIVATLKLQKNKRKGGRKKQEVKWTYETVAEPTGTS